MKKYLLSLIIICVILLPNAGSVLNTTEPTPPSQPTSGPGGSDYIHGGVQKKSYKFGAQQYWIFEPSDPKPESAPVILFIHGYLVIYPFPYIDWINHIVRKGNIVIYPRYQQGFLFGYMNFYKNAINAVKNAIATLNSGNHVRPELDKFAIVGHSFGGGLAAYITAVAEEENLPIPKAIMALDPFLSPFHSIDFNKIPSETLMIVVAGENDILVGDSPGKTIFYNTPQIPLSKKDFIIQMTDTYGYPDLTANHFAPIAFKGFIVNTVDALDYYCTWKLFDALTDFAFYGTNENYCLGNTPEQRFMGLWSDGTPVNELIVTDSP